SGFHAGSSVALKWDCAIASCTSTTLLATATADAAGAFTVAALAPASATAGSYYVAATDSAGAFTKTSFKIVPRLRLSPSTGPAGTAATATGDYYKPGETVTVLWDCGSSSCTSTTVPAAATADSPGPFAAVVRV